MISPLGLWGVKPAIFPTVAAVATSSPGSGTNHTITLPAGIVAGSLVIILSGPVSINFPGGWTTIWSQTSGITTELTYRFCDGSEGSSINVTTSGSTRILTIAYRIEGHHPSTPPEVGTAPSVVSTANPNPPSLSPSWGSTKNLWLAMTHRSSTTNVSSFPTNYSVEQTQQDDSGGNRTIAMAARQLDTGTEDPGSFSFSGAATAAAQTAVVRPA